MPARGQRNRMLAAARARRPPPRGRWRRGTDTVVRTLAAGPGDWWRARSGRARLLLLGGPGLVVVGVVVVLLVVTLTSGPAPRARLYLAFTACLLTDSHGLAGRPAAQAWSGMQKASLATRAKVEYLPVMSGSTPAAAMPYLASLLQRHCKVVIAAGSAQVAALVSEKGRPPGVRLVAMGSVPARSGIMTVPASGSGVASAVDQIITAAVAQSG
jgi:hypothetical protein